MVNSTWMLFLAAFLTKSSYGPQLYAGSFGSAGFVGRVVATIWPQSMSMRRTWTRRLWNAANERSGAMNDCDGSYMPTSIPPDAAARSGLADAARIDRTIVIRAMPIFLDPKWLPSEAGQHAAQPLFQLDLRFPAQQLPGSSDIGLANLGIVDW